MKNTYFFSHDYNSRSDSKIKKLLSKHGFLGYGLFWAIIEDLYNNANALRLDYDCIAFDLRSDSDIIKSIIEDFDLFVIGEGFFGSESVKRRLELRNEKSSKAADSARAKWEKKRKEDANALQTDNDPNASLQNRNAIKESKGNDNKEKDMKINDRTINEKKPNETKGEDDELPF